MDTDNDEFRRDCLKRLVERLNNASGRGGIARLARELEIAPSYVSRLLADPETNQRRSITGDMVLAITKLYPDWLSPSPEGQPIQTPAEPTADPDLLAVSSDGKVLAIDAKMLKRVQADGQKPVVLAVDELELLLHYRQLSPVEKEKYKLRISLAADIKRSEEALSHQDAPDRKSSE